MTVIPLGVKADRDCLVLLLTVTLVVWWGLLLTHSFGELTASVFPADNNEPGPLLNTHCQYLL